ncbi:MAG: glycosyltransferase, partial [Acidimicrobiales bacterium]
VRAFDRMAGAHPDLRLVLAGGDGWGVAAVDAAVASSRHRDRVLRTGYVPDDAVSAILRGAAAVAYPAAEEGFGLPALEALACEAPLVTTKGSVMEEVVGSAALLVPPGDTEGLAGALDMLVRGDARLAGRRALGRAIAAKHTWERCADAHVEVYRSALGG